MLRWLDSLRVQLVLLVIAALVLAQALSLWLFVDERSLAVREPGSQCRPLDRGSADKLATGNSAGCKFSTCKI